MKKKNITLLWAFFLPILILACVFYMRKITPFGDLHFFHEESLKDYSSLFSAFKDGLSRGNPFYSHQIGLGTNLWATISFYGMSPLHLIAMPFFPEHAVMGATFLFFLRVGLSGLMMARFVRRKEGLSSGATILLSLLYALGGNLLLSSQNPFGSDVFYLLPLLFAEYLAMLEGRRSWSFSAALFLLGVSSFSGLWALLPFLPPLMHLFYLSWSRKGIQVEREDSPVGLIFKQVFVGFFAASVCWLPVLYMLVLHGFPPIFQGGAELSGLSFSFFDFLSGSLYPVAKGAESMVFLLTGVLPLILIPLYLVHKKIPYYEKVYAGLLAAVLYFSLQIPPVHRILHLFSDGEGHRQIVVLVFLVIAVCSEVFRQEPVVHGLSPDYSPSAVLGAGMGVLGFALVVRQTNKDLASDWVTVIVCALAVMFMLMLYRWRSSTPKAGKIWMGVLVSILSYEMLVLSNSAVGYGMSGSALSSRVVSDRNLETVRNLNSELSGVTRMVVTPVISANDGFLFQGDSLSVRSELLSGDTIRLAHGLGLWTDGRSEIQATGINRASGLLLGISRQHVFLDEFSIGESQATDPAEDYADEGFAVPGVSVIFREQRVLADAFPLSFTSVGVMESGRNAKKVGSPFIYTNELYASLDLPEPYVSQEVKIESGANMDTQSSNTFWMENTGVETIFTVSVTADSDGGELFFYVDSRQNMSLDLQDADGSVPYQSFFRGGGRMIRLGRPAPGETILIKGKIPDVKQEFITFYAGILMDTAMEQAVSTVQGRAAQMVLAGTEIHGTVQADTDTRLVFTVPYDYGWKAKVDGRKTTVGRVGDFLSIPVSEGDHRVVLSYSVPGLMPGVLLSFFSVVGIVVLEITSRSKDPEGDV